MIHPDEISRKERFGGFYNHYVVPGIAPSGWSVPTLAQLTQLMIAAGDSLAGKNLKSIYSYHFDALHYGIDLYNFNILGGGYRSGPGSFYFFKYQSFIWSSSIYDINNAWKNTLIYDSSNYFQSHIGKNSGCNLLLVKDDVILPPGGSITDVDGNVYKCVKFDNLGITQVWTVSNWKSTKLANGTPIPIITDNTAWGSATTPAMCFLKNDKTLM